MKIPKYMLAPASPIGSLALRQAVKALEIEATLKRDYSSYALRDAAKALRHVANGQTWAQAFGWTE